MRPHCALYVDVGYLLASAATRLTGTSLRSGIDVDHEQLVAGLARLAVAESDLPLLRTHWYDSAPRGVPTAEQERIALLPHVKLRLGRIGYEGNQKGVDLRIGLDLVAHARTGAVDVAYLISGDDDLTEAVEEAQTRGVQVVVMAVPAATGEAHGVSRHLQQAADDLILVPVDALDAAVTRPGTTVTSDASGATPVVDDGSIPAPSPALFAKRPIPPVAPPSFRAVTRVETVPDRDPEEIADIVRAVAEKVVSTWLQGATADDRAEVLDNRPSVPRELDRALLSDASARLGMYDLGDRVRHDLRKQFWDIVTEADAGDSTPDAPA